MSKEKQIEFERNEISEIIAKNFAPNDEQYDPSDFEWAAHQLQMEGYHKRREDGKYIRLEDLKQFPIRKDHYDKEHGNEHFIFGVESVLEYAEHLPTYDGWISVEERLPEDVYGRDRKQITVLVCTKSGRVSASSRVRMMQISRDTWELEYTDIFEWSGQIAKKVTHWMPLPEAPKGGEE